MTNATGEKDLQEPLRKDATINSCTLEYVIVPDKDNDDGVPPKGSSTEDHGRWNQDRSTVPDFLQQQNVPLTVWQSTYDDVLKLNQDYPKREYPALTAVAAFLMTLAWMTVMFVPGGGDNLVGATNVALLLLGLFLLLWVTCLSQRGRNIATVQLIRRQTAAYRPYGVDVIWLPTRTGTSKTGFRFQRQQYAATTSSVKQLSVELERLYHLHSSGALTEEEYSQAKALVLDLPATTVTTPNTQDASMIV